VPVDVRPDLVLAHRRSLDHVVAAGARLDGTRRRELAAVARAAFLAVEAPPPWARPFGDTLLDAVHRLTRHAGTLTDSWYRQLVGREPVPDDAIDAIDELDWVEAVGVVCATVPVVAFARAAGLPVPDLPDAVPGRPTGLVADELATAQLNWVPVAAPADRVAAVVQALSAAPGEWTNLWQLAAAQYMSDRQMDDPSWNRGTLSRAQMELVAGRLSAARQCFY
jgi:hypothetical protein